MILAAAYSSHQYALFGMGLLTAMLTAFYMMRACALTFMGDPRERDRFAHAHESPWTMAVPLIVLAILSALVGFLMHHGDTLQKLFFWPGISEEEHGHLVMYLAIASALGGIALGWAVYLGKVISPQTLASTFRPLYVLFSNKWFVDEIVWAVVVRPTLKLCNALAWFDDHVIDKLGVDGTGWVTQKLTVIQSWLDDHLVDKSVDGSGWVVSAVGGLARRLQTGFVQNYILVITLGFMLLVFWKKLF
jgi:NADH-quinone oxidoreductase subunit L